MFGILFLPLLIGMGIWQLQRAAEKENALTQFNEQLQKAPVDWEGLDLNPQRFQQLQLTGSYAIKGDWLLDNQVHIGQFGYRVFTPFCRMNNCILVDRGWTKGDLDRRVLPDIPEPEGIVTIIGRLDKSTQNPVSGKDEPQNISPFRVQQINLGSVREYLELQRKEHPNSLQNPATPTTSATLYPWILRLEREQPGHFTVAWQPVVTGPEKHYGYAFQWFAMAIVLIILLFMTALKNRP